MYINGHFYLNKKWQKLKIKVKKINGQLVRPAYRTPFGTLLLRKTASFIFFLNIVENLKFITDGRQKSVAMIHIRIYFPVFCARSSFVIFTASKEGQKFKARSWRVLCGLQFHPIVIINIYFKKNSVRF